MTSNTSLKSSRLPIALGVVAALGAGAFLASDQTRAQNVLTMPATSGPAVVSHGFADLVARVKPAVVSVRVKRNMNLASMKSGDGHNYGRSRGNMPRFPKNSPFNQFFDQFQRGPQEGGRQPNRQRRTMSQGSGFFISADGYVVTNNHVVAKASKIEIVTSSGDVMDAELIGRDPKTDLALLKVKGNSKFDYVELTGTPARVGDWVVAVGNPFGLSGSVTTGIVSARGRDIGSGPYDDFIQIDAAINKGNSGGPAFNLKGEVIGVNTAIFSPSGGNVGIGFAIPASMVKSVIADLKDNGSVTRGWLGVQIQPITKDIAEGLGKAKPGGALVTDIFAGSPAKAAGFETGDAITAVNGASVKGPKELARMIAKIKPGEDVKLSVLRDGKKMQLTVNIAKLPNAEKQASIMPTKAAKTQLASLGLSLRTGGKGSTKGVVVSSVEADGPAFEKGVKAGDIILEVAGDTVLSPGDVATGIAKIRETGKKTALLLIKSARGKRFVALNLRKV